MGKVIPASVDMHGTVLDLKKAVQDNEGIPTDQQRLVYAGVDLEDGRRLILGSAAALHYTCSCTCAADDDAIGAQVFLLSLSRTLADISNCKNRRLPRRRRRRTVLSRHTC